MKSTILTAFAALSLSLSLANPAFADETEAAAEANLADRIKLCQKEQAEGGNTMYCAAASLAAGILYEESCDAGNLVHCDKYAIKMLEIDSTDGDFQPIGKMFEKACNGDYGKSCTELSYLFHNGWKGRSVLFSGEGLEPNPQYAKDFASRGCDLGSATGCHLMGVYAYTGSGMDKDLTAALGYFTKACEGNGDPSACSNRDAIKEELDAL